MIQSNTNTSSEAIRTLLPKILGKVDNPARYMGGEANGVHKDPAGLLARAVLLFPDIYEIGMSNNGFRILYHVLNREEDLAAELAFAPWPDMAEQLREHKLPLYTHESYTPISEFDVVGITLQTELNFTNVPYVLELGGIPAWSADRTEDSPLVIGGGPAVANPEPVADFFDAFVIGDGEKTTSAIVRKVGELRNEGLSRQEILRKLAELEGVYVPSLVSMVHNEFGELVPEHPATGSYQLWAGVKRTYVPFMDPADYPIKNVIPNLPLVQDRFAVEVMRGCTNGCRFCQAGYWYRPNRELDADSVVDIAHKGLQSTGERQLGLLSLSSADYSHIEELTDSIIEDDFFHSIDVSLPSLRADAFGQGLARKVAALKGGRSATFAPETGSSRIRKAINKTISNEDMYKAAEGVFKSGFNKIKLYTMVGFPTENLQDMEEFCELIEGLVEVGKKFQKRPQVHANIGILIPKSFTPLQWAPFMDKEKAMEHIYFVRERFYKHKNVRITWAGWETARLESFLSRGSRTLAPMIYKAYQKGMLFESDSHSIRPFDWEELWTEFDYNPDMLFRERTKEEVFPWDFMHIGVTKGYLRKEWDNFFNPESESVPDCKWGDCNHCGIPGNGEDTQLGKGTDKFKVEPRSEEEIRQLNEARRIPADKVYFYQLNFEKTGISAFLPHRNTLNSLEKALLTARIPLNLSSGFNPRPKIHNAGALPLGLSSMCEEILFESLQPLDLATEAKAKLIGILENFCPEGMKVQDIIPVNSRKLRKPQWIEYVFEGNADGEEVQRRFDERRITDVENHRGRVIAVQEEIIDLSVSPGEAEDSVRILVRAKTNDTGNSVSPYILFAGVLNLPEKQVRELPVCKTAHE